MWPFERQPSNRDLLERLESLERRFVRLLEDVDDFFQSVRRAENRIKEKRAKLEELAAEPTNGAGEGKPANDRPGMFLTPRQVAIQQQVLRRRTGGAM
jgi:hypothetical protein